MYSPRSISGPLAKGYMMIREVRVPVSDAGDIRLIEQMHKARARLFRDRLKWDVTVDERGCEHDQYDAIDPLYLIAVDGNGAHQGSLRLLPTSGPTMLAEHFSEICDGISFASPRVWECTRFCVDSTSAANLTRHGVQSMTTELMLGICEVGLREGWRFIVGVFDRRMIRIYRRAGWSPLVVGEGESAEGAIYLGLWEVSEAHAAAMREAAGIAGSVFAQDMSAAPVVPEDGGRMAAGGSRV